MEIRPRRRTERHQVGWLARYSPGATGLWFRCAVLDVSEAGAGLLVLGPPVEIGDRLIIELKVDDGQPDGIRLQAVARNATHEADGVRVGVEFAPATPLEASILAMLIQREAMATTR